ncbi:MAG TPA: VTT domain-containing protein [Vineibacter sp.]|nr:VTT domain-containing protein [Vineibacter sp.]
MLSDVTTWFHELIAVASSGMTAPWLIALSLALLTLLLEDAAIAAGIVLVGEGVIGLPLAFIGVAGGIAAGDLLLYLLGLAARRASSVRRRLATNRHAARARAMIDTNLATAVLVARVVPGLRLAIYTASGLFRVPFAPFALLVAIAVTTWTAVLFWLGATGGVFLMRHLGVPSWLAAIALFLLLTLLPVLARRLTARASVQPR